jgi:DNA-binding MarR family transcriptional regulator
MKNLDNQDKPAGMLARLALAVRTEREAAQAFDEAASDVLGVNRTDLRCLGILQRSGPIPASQLAQETGLTSGAATALIDRLERAGYVRRTRDDQDRRRVFVEVTAPATEATTSIWGPLGREGAAMVGHYSRPELELIIGYLEENRALLTRHRERVARLRTGPPPRA